MTQSVTTADELRRRLGRIGIFAGPPARLGVEPAVLAASIERAGFASAWIGGGNATPGDFEALDAMLTGTAVTPHGTQALVAGVRAHLEAGADHVVIQPLAQGGGFSLIDLEPLAAAVASLTA